MRLFLRALAAAAATMTLAATAAGAGSPKTFSVYLPGTKSTYVDVGRKGYSPGDYFLATGRLLSRAGGARIGGLAGVWTLRSPAADDASITLRLPQGTLFVAGRIHHTAKSSTLRVTGGTDSYAGARGVAVLRYLSETTAEIGFALD